MPWRKPLDDRAAELGWMTYAAYRHALEMLHTALTTSTLPGAGPLWVGYQELLPELVRAIPKR